MDFRKRTRCEAVEKAVPRDRKQIISNVNPGIIVSSLGYWRQNNTKGTVNSISSAEFANMGHAPTFSDNLVEVEKLV